MSSASRACVHKACTVYIALPSACNETTRRSGQAIAAPVASGMPSPIEPPMLDIQSCGIADLVLLGARQHMPLAALRRQLAWLVGVGEERNRHLRADQDDMLQAVEDLQRLVDDIRDALDRHPAAAALGARVRALRHEPRAAF